MILNFILTKHVDCLVRPEEYRKLSFCVTFDFFKQLAIPSDLLNKNSLK